MQPCLCVRQCATYSVGTVSFNSKRKKKWNWDSEKLVNGEIEIPPWISATLHWAALVPQKALRRIRINSWFALCLLILASQSVVCGPAALRSCQKCRVSGPNPDLWIRICFSLRFLGRLQFQMHCSVSLPKDMTNTPEDGGHILLSASKNDRF